MVFIHEFQMSISESLHIIPNVSKIIHTKWFYWCVYDGNSKPTWACLAFRKDYSPYGRSIATCGGITQAA